MNHQLNNLPETVKVVRWQRVLFPKELAYALGVSFAMVNHWENGKTIPSKLAQQQFEQCCVPKREEGELT